MARKKSYSSELTSLIDLTDRLLKGLKSFSETVSGLISDSEKYQELKPILFKIGDINAGKSPDGVIPDKEPPVNLCDHCKNEGDSENCHGEEAEKSNDIVIKCPGFTVMPLPDATNGEVKKRRVRINKKLTAP